MLDRLDEWDTYLTVWHLAYLTDREEGEVIVDPATLLKMTVRPLTDSDRILAERLEQCRQRDNRRRLEKLAARRKATILVESYDRSLR